MDSTENLRPEEAPAEPAPAAVTDASADAAPPPGDAAPPQEQDTWLADNWRWMAGGVLAFGLLMYPIVRRVANSPDSAPANAPVANNGALPDLLTLSMQYYQAKRYPEAIVASKAAIELNPNSADAYNNLGVSFAGLGRWAEAEASLRQALRINPNYELAKNNLAWISSQSQQTVVKEGTPEAFLNKSLAEYQAGHYQESIAAAQSALQLRPNYPEAYNNLCVSYISLHQYDQAIQAGQNAVRLNPNFALAKNNLAWAETEKQKALKK